MVQRRWLLRKFFILLLVKIIYGYDDYNSDFESIQICNSKYIDPRKTRFFFNNTETKSDPRTNVMLKKLLQSIPSVTMNLEDISSIYSNTSELNFNLATFNVILCGEFNVQSLRSIIDIIVELDSVNPRPKTLLIFHSYNFSSSSSTKEVLEYAWDKKFLDFTIMNEHCAIQYYRINYLLLPNKLSNVNGYDFKIGVISTNAEYQAYRHSNGSIFAIQAFMFPITYTVLSFMNFSLQYVEVGQNKSYVKGLEKVIDKLGRNEVNLAAIPSKFTGDISHSIVQLDLENDCQNLVAMMPITSAVKLYLPMTVVTKLVLIPCAVIMAVYIATILKIVTDKWTALHSIRIICGVPMNRRLQRSPGRIMFVSVFIVSLLYSADFYSNFLNVELGDDEISFDTFESIDASGLKAYLYSGFYNHAFWQENFHVQSIQRRTERVPMVTGLIESLVNGSDRYICIDTENFLRIFMNRSLYPIQKARLAKPVFNCLRLVYNFERSSPYARAFQAICRRMYEAGLDIYLQTPMTEKAGKKDEDEEAREALTLKLVIILLAGYTVAMVVFIFEWKIVAVFKDCCCFY